MFNVILSVILIVVFVGLLMIGCRRSPPKSRTEKCAKNKSTELNENLMRMLQRPIKQPELWWGDECVTLSDDGKKIIHLKRPVKNMNFWAVGAGGGSSAGTEGSGLMVKRNPGHGGSGYFCFESYSGKELFDLCVDGKSDPDLPDPWGTVRTN